MAAAQPAEEIDAARLALARGDFSRAEDLCARLVGRDARNSAAWHILGLARQKLGQTDPAIEALSKATVLDRDVARYHHDLGNALIDANRLDRAISAFRRALRLDDGLAEVHNDLGAAYFKKGWYPQAEECFRNAVERDPRHGVAHANRGAALRAQGRLNDARRAYQRALWLKLRALLPGAGRRRNAPAKSGPASIAAELEPVRKAVEERDHARAAELARGLLRRHPEHPDALHACAIAHEAAREYEEALKLVRRALERRADRSEYQVTLARLLLRAGEVNGALDAATRALTLEPGAAGIHATISGIFHQWRDDLAEQAARHAIGLDADLGLAHANLAAALWGQGRLEEAERAAREAVRLEPRQVGFKTNLALILKDLGRIEEVRALYRELAAHAPEHGKVCLDFGTLAMESEGDLRTARAMYRKAQASADEPRAYLAEALVDFLEGDFAAAWPNYEARKQLSDQRGHHAQFASIADWDGGRLREGKLLVYGEQGLGDEVMFASLYPELAQRAGDVAVLCDPRLARLFQRSFPGMEILGEPRATQRQRIATHAGIRCKVAAGSLGAMFRREASDFPVRGGYLVADAGKVQAWRERLAGGADLKVGLSWIGGVQRTGRGRRSIALKELAPLLELAGTRWVSLQYTDAGEEIAACGAPILQFPGVTGDMDELASLMGALDVVVSVCNTTVHLAGALGREVLVMAPFVPEWRYGMSGERMAWYPSARMFRQSAYGDWNGVIARVKQTLTERTARSDSR